MVPTLSTFPANAISLPMLSLDFQSLTNCMMNQQPFLDKIFAFDKQIDAFPIAFDTISKAQLTDNKIQ
jgi:hypothetical protein